MANKQIYISCPIVVDEQILNRFASMVNGMVGLKEYHWGRRSNRYSEEKFYESDAYLFILPHNKFKASNDELPIGLKRELKTAHETGKRIFVGYITKSGDLSIYSARTNGRDIEGIPGTTHEISSLGLDVEKLPKYDPETFEEIKSIKGNINYSFDERALLMLS